MPRPSPLALSVALAAATALLLPACGITPVRPTRAWHGVTPISATYRYGRLTADLPPGVRVESATIAARHTLERQGHTIASADITPGEGKLVALAPPTLGYDKVTVRAAFQGQGTVLRIDLTPPNENRTRAVFETILQTMGL